MLGNFRGQAARVREAVGPGWLVDIVCPSRLRAVGAMVWAALAICVPLAAGLAAHDLSLGLLPAFGGLIAVFVDVGGPDLAWVKRVGLATGSRGGRSDHRRSDHGRGWTADLALVLLAGVSVVGQRDRQHGLGVGLQLLVFAASALAAGGLRPWWTGPSESHIGVAWAMILIILGLAFESARPNSTPWPRYRG